MIRKSDKSQIYIRNSRPFLMILNRGSYQIMYESGKDMLAIPEKLINNLQKKSCAKILMYNRQ